MSETKTGRSDSRRYLKLIEIQEIRELIKSALANYVPSVEEILVDRSLGRICAEEIHSEFDIPARSIAAMDGYAIRSVELSSASASHPTIFKIKGVLHPDSYGNTARIRGKQAYQVSTGAPIPAGSDAVVRIEDTRLDKDRIIVIRKIEKSKNVSWKGEDIRAGEVIFQKGRIFSSTDVAVLIGAGRRRVRVSKVPVVGILSVGNELVEFDGSNEDPHGANEVINNYAYLISGFSEQSGATVRLFGVAKDDPDQIKSRMRKELERCDALFTIAGSSVGAKDFAPDAAASLPNSKMIFHGVRVVPIRPAGLALAGGKPVLIIPGHAVSAALTFFVIGLPILNILSGLDPDSRRVIIRAEATAEFANNRPIDALILAVAKKKSDGEYYAVPLEWGSNVISNLSRANGYVWMSPNQKVVKSESVTVELFELSRILDR